MGLCLSFLAQTGVKGLLQTTLKCLTGSPGVPLSLVCESVLLLVCSTGFALVAISSAYPPLGLSASNSCHQPSLWSIGAGRHSPQQVGLWLSILPVWGDWDVLMSFGTCRTGKTLHLWIQMSRSASLCGPSQSVPPIWLYRTTNCDYHFGLCQNACTGDRCKPLSSLCHNHISRGCTQQTPLQSHGMRSE